MTLIKHELKQGRFSFLIWTGSICFLLLICIFLFPQIKEQMSGVNKLFSSMGAFSAAFGMDKLNFGTFIGFYAVECGNILGLGGALYASVCAANILCKEEKERTSEFLLTHPIKRTHILSSKLIAVIIQIILMNGIIFMLVILSTLWIQEPIPWSQLTLIHLAYFILQIELAGICFGFSAFIRKNGLSMGLGIALMMYFLNLIANMTKSVKFLKLFTPFGYCESADIIASTALDLPKIIIGLCFATIAILLATYKYCKKDIYA